MKWPYAADLRRSNVALVLIAAAASCLSAPSVLEPPPAGGIHVLFIGNSLTYVNDLPGTVAAIAASVGDTVRAASVTGPDLALIDHLNGATNAVKATQLGGWKYVVLQQGSSSLPANRDTLVLGALRFDSYVRAQGGRSALYMVWPTIDRLAFFDAVRQSYLDAATAVNGVFMPAGEAWRTAWASDSTLQFFASDGLHPTELGTYLAALVIYERVTGHDARLLPPRATMSDHILALPETTVRLLQNAAHTTNSKY